MTTVATYVPSAMSQSEMYSLATRARSKLSREASRGDHDLRVLVSHANLLDNLMDTLSAARVAARKAQLEQRRLQLQAPSVTFQLPTAHRSTSDIVHVTEAIEDDSESDSESDSDSDYEPARVVIVGEDDNTVYTYTGMPTIGEDDESTEEPQLCYSSSDDEDEEEEEEEMPRSQPTLVRDAKGDIQPQSLLIPPVYA